jgi:hypothetical protein
MAKGYWRHVCEASRDRCVWLAFSVARPGGSAGVRAGVARILEAFA